MKKMTALGALVAAALGLAADQAAAAYTGKVEAGKLTLAGDGAGETLVLHVRSGEPGILEADVGGDEVPEFAFDRSTFTAIEVLARGGDDTVRVDARSGGFADEVTIIDGGAGADTLIGHVGVQTLIGGSGNDTVAGGFGDDRALLGSGDDTFSWNPGDSSDTVEGEGGDDVLDFNGSGASETFDVSANGERVQLLRNVANIAMDLGGVETADLSTAAGNDTIVAGAGLPLTTFAIGLGADAVADSVIVGATTEADEVEVGSEEGGVVVSGLGADVRVSGGEANDEINLGTGEGDDTITTSVETTGAALIDVDGGGGTDTVSYEGTAAADAIHVTANGAKLRTGGPASAPFDTIVEELRLRGLGGDDLMTAVGNTLSSRLTYDGGAGADDLRGSAGPDLLLGGSGNDKVDGNLNMDVAELGSGNDRFNWDPGDSNDTVDGQGGADVVDFNASNAGESIALSADGERTLLTRNIGNVTMDADVEAFAVRTLGGADTVTVNPLAAEVDVDMAPDGQADAVIANGTGEADAARISRTGGQARVRGLGAETRVAGGEPALDVLRVQTLAGDDEVTIASNLGDLIGLAVDLGADD